MTHIGNAVVGKNCNIGCGVVFCNFAGKRDANGKSIRLECTVGDNAFIGSNSNLIAPLVIGDNAFIGAGSTITQDVPSDALALGRARQAIKENFRADEGEN